MPDIEKHKRINDIFLAPLERPALHWLAVHTPGWMTPDHLTLIGIFGAVLILFSYLFSNFNDIFLWFASLGFLINWYGDSLDGTLARYRQIQRPKYGFFIDHTIDAFNEMMIFLGFGLSPFLRFDVACLALIGYLLMSVLVYVRTCVKGEFVISYIGIGPTEMRVIAVIVNMLLFFFVNPVVYFGQLAISIFDIVGLVIAAALLTVFLISTYSQAKELARIDPPL